MWKIVHANKSVSGSHYGVAEIDGKFYPYSWDLRAGQVTVGNSYASGLTADAIKYVATPYDSLATALGRATDVGRTNVLSEPVTRI